MRGSTETDHFKVVNDAGEVFNPRLLVFPIFLATPDSRYRFLGTGFFITKYGWFITAKHVLEEATEVRGNHGSGIHIIQSAPANKFYIRPVKGFARHPTADVAVGICHEMTHRTTGAVLHNIVPTITAETPEVGETVWTYAYPGTTVEHADQKKLIAVDPRFYKGEVQELHPEGRDRVLLPGACFRTSMVLHGGSSGGPVFAAPGHVFGVNSTGFDAAEDLSYVSWIGDVIPLSVPAWVEDEGQERPVSVQELILHGHVAWRGGD